MTKISDLTRTQALSIFAVLVLFLNACEQQPATLSEKLNTIQMPKAEKDLILRFHKAALLVDNEVNDVGKRAVVDSMRERLSSYMVDTLKLKVTNWLAIVTNISGGITPEIELMLPTNDEHPEYSYQHAILLYSGFSSNTDTLEKIIRPLQKGDTVLLSGDFDTNMSKNIDILADQALSLDRSDNFKNPSLRFNFTSIKKKPNLH